MRQNIEQNGITLLGLGPGDPGLLTQNAKHWLEGINRLVLRTKNHPVASILPETIQITSFDDLFDHAASYEDALESIVEEVLALGALPGGVTYAVPGDPFTGETTCSEIKRRAEAAHLPVRVIHGLSFLEPTFSALNLDPFPELILMDALHITDRQTPGFPPSSPALITFISSRMVASDVKLALMAVYPDEHPVRLVHAAGMEDEMVEDLPLHAIDHSRKFRGSSSLFVPPLSEFASFESFQEIIAQLRAPEGCPWDRKQTHASLRPFLLEETYETLDALDREDRVDLQEELGDLLLQIFLHAQIATEEGDFNIHHVLEGIGTKLVRRHPHVFGDVAVVDVSGVIHNWEAIKAEERLENGNELKKGLLDGVPQALPALSQAQAVIERVGRVAFDPLIERANPEVIRHSLKALDDANSGDKPALLGDLLLDLAALGYRYGIDAESVLREQLSLFKQHFSRMENRVLEKGQALGDLTAEEKNLLWKQTGAENDQSME